MAGARWGAHYDVLRQTTLSVVNSVADFGSPIWLNGKHTNLVDVQLNEALRLVSGVVRATPLVWLPVFSNIIPPELRRKKALCNLLFKTNQIV